jgi:hypothetical protein
METDEAETGITLGARRIQNWKACSRECGNPRGSQASPQVGGAAEGSGTAEVTVQFARLARGLGPSTTATITVE